MPRGGTCDAGGCRRSESAAGSLPAAVPESRPAAVTLQQASTFPTQLHFFFKGKEEEPLTAAENKLLLASSAWVRVRVVQLLGGVLRSLLKRIVTWMVLSSLGGWKGWGGFSGDLLRCCCGQGDISASPQGAGWSRRDWLSGAGWWLVSRAWWDLSIIFWKGLSVWLKFGSFSGLVGNCIDPSHSVSTGVGYVVDGGYVVDSARAKAALGGRSHCLSRPCARCCWPCSLCSAGFAVPQWRAAGRRPPSHRVSSFAAHQESEAPTLKEQAEEHLAPGTEVWQMLLPGAVPRHARLRVDLR